MENINFEMSGNAEIYKRRIRTNFSVHQKLEAVRRVTKGGESKAQVARDMGIPESTLRGWCKMEAKLEQLVNQLQQSSQSTDGMGHSMAFDDEHMEQSPPKKIKLEVAPDVSATNNASSPGTSTQNSLYNLSQLQQIFYEVTLTSLQNYYKNLINYNTNTTNTIQNNLQPNSTVNFINDGLLYNKSVFNGQTNIGSSCSNDISYMNGVTSTQTSRMAPNTSAVEPATSVFADANHRSASEQSLAHAATPPTTFIPSSDNSNGIEEQEEVSREQAREGADLLLLYMKTGKSKNVTLSDIYKLQKILKKILKKEEQEEEIPARIKRSRKINEWIIHFYKNLCPFTDRDVLKQ